MSALESSEDLTSDAQLAIERRNARDRRKPTFKGFLIGCIKCRRRGSRRAHGSLYYETDWYDAKLLVMALGLLLLSIIDAALTLHLIKNGASEVNPFMHYLLHQGVQVFISVKIAITSVCILILVAHYHAKAFKYLRVDIIFLCALFIYSGLVTYELFLILNPANYALG